MGTCNEYRESTPVRNLPDELLVPVEADNGKFSVKLHAEIDGQSLEDFAAYYEDSNNDLALTKRFLESCLRVGIDVVSIGEVTKIIHSTVRFPFGTSGSVFSREFRCDGWPAVWRAVEITEGLKMGCGNSNQAQYKEGKLINGVYVYKDGIWHTWHGG